MKTKFICAIAVSIWVLLICNSVWSDENYPYMDELNEYINNHFNSYKIVKIEDYEAYILKFMTPTTNIIGDFDGNGHQDICLVLKALKKGIYVIAFHRFEKSFKHFVIKDRGFTNKVRENLRRDGPGHVRISSPDADLETKSIKNSAIVLKYIETCSETLYIWDKDRYKS